MSKQTFAEAFAPWEAHYKSKVMESTWGHLAPKKNKIYNGYIVFCVSVYGDIVPINNKFKGLPDSPWFYETLQDFVCENSKKKGVVYRFDGTFCNYKFSGMIREISTEI